MRIFGFGTITASGSHVTHLNQACSDSELMRYGCSSSLSNLHGDLPFKYGPGSSSMPGEKDSILSSKQGIFMSNVKHNVTEKVAQVSLKVILPLHGRICGVVIPWLAFPPFNLTNIHKGLPVIYIVCLWTCYMQLSDICYDFLERCQKISKIFSTCRKRKKHLVQYPLVVHTPDL